MLPPISGLAAVSLLLFAGQTVAGIDESQYKPEDIVTRDVAVIGGGAAGAYAAVRLRDQGKSVVVIEKEDHMGGHVDTYNDPKTGAPVDYGVLAYIDLPGVKDFFSRFNVPIVAASQPPFQDLFIDFSTGKKLPNFPAVDQASQAQALGLYAQLCLPYFQYTFPSLTALPAPLPDELAELLMPFGKFVEKHNLQAMIPIIFPFIASVGDVYNASTAFIMTLFGPAHIQALSSGGFFTPASHNNSQLYGAVEQYLGNDLLLSSHVSRGTRDDKGVVLMVKTPKGAKLVKAKKLLITIPPLTDSLYPFDLDSTEKGAFGKWVWEAVYAAVFSNTGLPDGLVLRNFSPDTPLNMPKPPNFADTLSFTGIPGLYRTYVSGSPGMGVQDAKLLIRDALQKIGSAGTLPTKRLEFAAFSSHTPLEVRFGADDIKSGAYRTAFGMNGRRSTFYTGAAWASDYTSVQWVYAESVILPMILASF